MWPALTLLLEYHLLSINPVCVYCRLMEHGCDENAVQTLLIEGRCYENLRNAMGSTCELWKLDFAGNKQGYRAW